MADYIDREELLRRQKTICGDYYDTDGEPLVTFQVVTTFDIGKLPSVDAVEVVRCKDCKHNISGFCAEFERIMPSGQQGGVRHEWHKVNDEDYCKWGEKNENIY